jgi:hypothetical protein
VNLIAVLSADRTQPLAIPFAERMLGESEENLLPNPGGKIKELPLIFLLLFPLF